MSSAEGERATLLRVLAINLIMFVVELVAGWLAQSMGLIADSLDMLADAAVYAAALWAVGSSATRKADAATASGIVQLLLAVGVIAEVGRRAVMGSEPVSLLMIAVSAIALGANATCIFLLREHRHGDVHMRASWIFTTTDVQANFGVIVAGVLVMLSESPWPDLIAGLAVSAIVVRGGIRILADARGSRPETASPGRRD